METSKFKEYRVKRHLRCEDVAAQARISVTTVRQLDRGNVPSPVVRWAVSKVLGVPEAELFPTVN